MKVKRDGIRYLMREKNRDEHGCDRRPDTVQLFRSGLSVERVHSKYTELGACHNIFE